MEEGGRRLGVVMRSVEAHGEAVWEVRRIIVVMLEAVAKRNVAEVRALMSGEQEVLGWVMKMMEKYVEDRDVQECGCRALRALDKVRRAEVLEAGALQSVLAAMDGHRGAARVQAWACSCFTWLLAFNSSNKSKTLP